MNWKPTATLETKINKIKILFMLSIKQLGLDLGFYLFFPTFLTAILTFNACKENKSYR